jgi:nucleoside-diphosphate-sugar epimerase
VRKPVVFITGASGEIGHALLHQLARQDASIVTLDVNPLDATLAPLVRREFRGSITDGSLLERILAEFEVTCVFHLAALLSSRAEFTPVAAHHVNVEGTLNLLEFGPHGRLRVSILHRDVRPAGPRDEDSRRACA